MSEHDDRCCMNGGPGWSPHPGCPGTEALFAAEHAHELNPPPSSGPALDMLCRGGSHEACVGPPGTKCECRCHWRPSPTSTVSDEVYDGTRCAICEEQFKPGEDWWRVPITGECVHVSCWEATT